MATQLKHSFRVWNVISYRTVADRMCDRKLVKGPDFTLKELLIAYADKCTELRLEQDEVQYCAWSLMLDIVEASAAGHQLSYLDLWHRYNEGDYPGGNSPITPIKAELERVSGVCEAYGLPLLSILIVENGSRKLSPKATDAFWKDRRYKNVLFEADTKEEFVEKMTALALEIRVSDLNALV